MKNRVFLCEIMVFLRAQPCLKEAQTCLMEQGNACEEHKLTSIFGNDANVECRFSVLSAKPALNASAVVHDRACHQKLKYI